MPSSKISNMLNVFGFFSAISFFELSDEFEITILTVEFFSGRSWIVPDLLKE